MCIETKKQNCELLFVSFLVCLIVVDTWFVSIHQALNYQLNTENCNAFDIYFDIISYNYRR